MNMYLDITPEVKAALEAGKPVVALESTIISHGMPYPKNVETALLVEQTIRDNGATPATIAVIGGRLNSASFCVNGAATLQQLESINFQTVFLGTMGFSQARGFTCGSEEDCAVKRAAIRQSEKVVMLMDSQKVEVTGTFTFAETADVNVLVTDTELPERAARFFERNNVEVV